MGAPAIAARVEAQMADMVALRRLYKESVAVAETIWESAGTENQPDATAAHTVIDGLYLASSYAGFGGYNGAIQAGQACADNIIGA